MQWWGAKHVVLTTLSSKRQERNKILDSFFMFICKFVFQKLHYFQPVKIRVEKKFEWSFSPLSMQLLLSCRLNLVPCTNWLSTIEYIFSCISVFLSQITLTEILKCKCISASVNLNTYKYESLTQVYQFFCHEHLDKYSKCSTYLLLL